MVVPQHPTSVNVGTGVLGYDTGVTTDVQVFTADGTWTKPSGAKSVHVAVVAAGGGGGSGRRGAAGSVRCGGGGGGGGAISVAALDASGLGATVAVTVGVAGSGGAAVAVNSTNG